MSRRASVVVLTRNRSGELRRCIRSLFAQSHRPLEIVVVDDASSDDTPAVLAALRGESPPDVELLGRRHEENLGVGPGRNTGIAASTGEIVAFLDDDSEARRDWVEQLVGTFAESPEIAIAGGAYDEPEDRTWAQRAAEGIVFLGTRRRDVSSVTGGNMAFRRGFLERHPFDPTVRYGADEIDLCFAASAEGLRVRFNPDARVVHHHRRTVREFLRQQFRRGKGSVWVRRKHHRETWPRKNWVVLALLLAGAAALVFPGRATIAAVAALAVLFLVQIVALDVARGKRLPDSLATLPLTAPGYLVEFAGAVAGLLQRRGRTSVAP